MSESILKYISKVDLTLGCGISNFGQPKASPFVYPLQPITSNSNNDEFGYHVVSESTDIDNLKSSTFGIDLNTTLPVLGGTNFNLEFSKTFKSNEIIVQAYRKITKTSLRLDDTQFPKFSDEAINVLRTSTKQFHDTYGHYFIREMVRGGALSVTSKIYAEDAQSKHDIAQKLKIDGQIKVVKGDVTEEIRSKKSMLTSQSMNECKSTSLGLTVDVKSTDFSKMLAALEELESHIDQGSVIYYEVCKYELCNEYNKIINEKSIWQKLLETFYSLDLKLQKSNIEIFKQIMFNIDALKGEHKNDVDKVALKSQEIDIQLKLDELVISDDLMDLDTRILSDCVNYIKVGQFEAATKSMKTYGSPEFICKIIKSVFEKGKYIEESIKFAKQLTNSLLAASAFVSIFEQLNANKMTTNPAMVKLAFQVKKYIENQTTPLDCISNALFEYLRLSYSDPIRRIIWHEHVFIKNKHSKGIVYSDEPSDHHGYRSVSARDAKMKDIASWKFISNDGGRSFYIQNKENKEYLFVHVNSKYKLSDSSNNVKDLVCKLVYTRADMNLASNWILKPQNNGTIMISDTQTEYYLYVTSHYLQSIVRSDVLARPNTSEWHETENELRSFLVEREERDSA